MSGYTVTLPRSATITWTDAGGTSRTETVQPGLRDIGNPCEMASFVRAYMAETGIDYAPQSEDVQLASMDAACQGAPTPQTVTQTTEMPDPVPPDVPDPPADETPGQEIPVNPPANPYTPDAVEASPPNPAVEAERRDPPVPGQADPSVPAEQRAHDPATPSPEGYVPAEGDAGGGPDARGRILRNEPTPGLPHYEFGLNDSSDSTVAADPVDLFSGSYGLIETDFELPGRRFPLVLRRRYRSGAPYYGPWGFGWDHNHNSYARPLDDGYVAVWTGLINEDVHAPDPAGGFIPPLGRTSRLTHFPANAGQAERYELRSSEGSIRLYMRPDGWPLGDRLPLTRFEDRFGNGHDYAYRADGRLLRVSDDAGQHLEFGYGACDLLEWVQDHTGRTFRYDHDGDRAHLLRVRRPATLEAPDGAAICYEYDAFEAHGRLRHNIIRIIDEEGSTKLTNLYGKDPGSPDFGRVITQTFGCHRADFHYTLLASPSRLASAIDLPARRTEVVVDREYKLMTFNFRGDLLEERYRLARDGSFRTFARAQRYDKRGNLRLVAMPNGMTELRQYDVDNPDPAAWANLLQVDQSAPPSRPTPGRRIARMRYEPRYQLLSLQETESGATTRLRYDHETVPGARGALVSAELPDAVLPDGSVQTAVMSFTANAAGQVETRTTPEGVVLRHGYDARGWLTEIERDPGGLALMTRYAYDDHGNATEMRDGEGHAVLFEFDARNRLVRAVKPEIDGTAPEIRLTYHATDLPASHIRPAGAAEGAAATTIETRYEYDVLGRQTLRIDAAGTAAARETAFTYDAWDRITSVTDPLGRITRHGYDERGRPLTLERSGQGGAARSLRWIHDINGMTTAVLFADGSREDYAYDAWDRPIRVSGTPTPDGTLVSQFTFGDDDLVTAVQTVGPDGNGSPNAILAEHGFEHDARRRLIAQDCGIGRVETWFDADGSRTRLIGPSGDVTAFEYDGAGRPSAVVDPAGNRVEFECDRADRVTLVRERDAVTGATREERRSYDARGQQTDHTDLRGGVTRYSYDAAGRLILTEGSDGNVFAEIRNLHGEPVEMRRSNGGAEQITRIARDAGGRATAVTDPTGAATSFEFDDFDAVTRRIYADGAADLFEHDAGGRLVSSRAASGTRLDYTLREDGATVGMNVAPAAGMPPMPAIGFGRDGLGRAVRITQGTETVTRGYDSAGRLVADSHGGRSIGRSYDDAAGRDTRIFGDGRRDRYQRDGLDRVLSVVLDTLGADAATGAAPAGTSLASYAYEGLAPASRTTVSGVGTAYAHAASLDLTRIAYSDAGGAPLVALDYGFDAGGRRTSITASGAPWASPVFARDELGHLRLSQTAARAQTYTVDAAEARQSRQIDTGGVQTDAATPTDSRHRITDLTVTEGAAAPVNTPFSYGPDGTIRSDDRHSYDVDALGRITGISRLADDAPLLTLEWDPAGRLARIARAAGGAVTLHRFGETLIEEVHAPSGRIVQHTHGAMPREHLAQADGALHFPLQDARGSALGLTSDVGAFEERRRHDAFGRTERLSADGAAILPEDAIIVTGAFGGMHYLPDVDLYLAGPRLYDPRLGRFLSADPMGQLDGPNPYAYCDHDPVDKVDANGRYVESAWDVFSLGVGVASLSYNLSQDDTDWWAVGLDVVGIVADTAALVLPGVPGGAGAGIKAMRAAGIGADIASTAGQVTRAGRAVRYTQAAHGVTLAGRGVYMSYEQAREGNYGMAALGVGLSAMGFRGSLGRFQTALRTGRVPDALYSVQGNAGDILRTGRIWGMTEGRVWAGTQLGAGASRTGMSAADLPPAGDRLVLEFTEGAQDLFTHHGVWGFFTGWKGIWGNQHVTEIGDVALSRMSEVADWSANIQGSGLMGYFVRVTDAAMIAPPGAHQALWRSNLRSSLPYFADFVTNILPGIYAAGMGMNMAREDASSRGTGGSGSGAGDGAPRSTTPAARTGLGAGSK